MVVMFAGLVLTLAMLQAPQAQPPREAAYLDAAARDLVARARSYRDHIDRSISRYQTRGLERITLGVSALRRERLMYRREIATRIDWQRDGIPVVEVEGAREVIPVAFRGVQLPDDLDSDVMDQAFDPGSDRLFLGLRDSSFIFHPLGRLAENHYRFRSGDTTQIRLQDGRTLRLAALEIIPAIRDVHHVTGTIWIDTDSNAMVRGVFTLADEFRLARDVEEDEDDDIPGWLNVISADVKYLTIEYGLWQLRWWLPRMLAFEASASVGSLVHFPLRYEMRWDAYTVEGDTTMALVPRPRDESGRIIYSNRGMPLSEMDTLVADSIANACYAKGYCRCDADSCRNFRVIVPDDTMALLESSRLPPSPYSEEHLLLSEAELESLEEALREGLPEAPWQLPMPEFAWGLADVGLIRYNRVEALSIGARSRLDLGKLQLEGEARLGVADLEPNGELRVMREGRNTTWTLGGYRRLAAMDASARPLGFGNSFNALFLGRDDGEYFRTLGAELRLTPSDPTVRGWEFRLFGERQRLAEVETEASLPHLFDRSQVFRPNRAADDADQAGAEAVLRYDRGLDPNRVRWGLEVQLLGSTGTYDFARGSLGTHVIFPIGSDLTGSLEGVTGWSGGSVPVQSLWYLGGPGSLRGYSGATLGGESFWRGRAEIGYGFPGASLALFGDAGWAGPRDLFTSDPAMIGVGVGGSFMDGLIRVDLARAIRGPTGWRLDLYLDGLI